MWLQWLLRAEPRLADLPRNSVRATPSSKVLGQLRERIDAVAKVAPRAYWYVWWGTLVNRLGGFAIPLLTIYLTTDRGVSVSDAGGVVSIFGLGQVVASIAGGQMSDRLGRKITMVSSLFGGAAAMFGLAFARDISSIAVWVGIVGFVGELYRPAVAAVIEIGRAHV